MSNSSKELRDNLSSKSILKIGGGFDALSAKLVELNKVVCTMPHFHLKLILQLNKLVK